MSRKNSIATILYTENVSKETYIEHINDLHINAYMSPLHTDEGKKEHYHLMLFFGSLKSDSQIKEIVDIVGGVGCEPIISNRQYARYLCHLDYLVNTALITSIINNQVRSENVKEK